MAEWKDKIDIWKNKHGLIFKIDLNHHTYIYRKLNVFDCQTVQLFISANQEYNAENYVAENNVLYPRGIELDKRPAGEVNVLVRKIISLAGFFSPVTFHELINKSENYVNGLLQNDFFLWKMAIMQTFTGYTFEDLDKLDGKDFIHLVHIAEHMRGEKLIQAQTPAQEIIEGEFEQEPRYEPHPHYSAFEIAAGLKQDTDEEY